MRAARYLFLTLLLTALAPAVESQKGKPPASITVTSTLYDAGDVTQSTNHRIQSDGSGSYYHGVANVVSIIQGIGDWELDTASSATRRLLIDFREPVSLPASSPFIWQIYPARIIVKCTDVGGTFQAIALNSSLNCPMAVSFTYPASRGSNYRIAMNSLNYGETNFAKVTCTGADSSASCNHWTVQPSATQPDGRVINVSKLLKIPKNGSPQPQGNFYMSFSIDVMM